MVGLVAPLRGCGLPINKQNMKSIFIILGFLLCANFAASQNPDSIYIQKDQTTNNVLIYDASDSTLVYSFIPTHDLRYGGERYVFVERNGQEVYAIKVEDVTSTIVAGSSTAFSGTAKQLLLTLATDFFYIP